MMSALPFTLQEWVWSVKNGYLDHMLGHNFRHGGLAAVDAASSTSGSSAGFVPQPALPMTLQEWSWAARDGYLPDMIRQSYRSGAL